MTALIQRVKSARVDIDGSLCSEIGARSFVQLGVFDTDDGAKADLLADKTAKLRIFEDENGKMNLSPCNLLQTGGKCEILVVSQFTLCADCKGQNRPSFIKAARPKEAVVLYERYVNRLTSEYSFSVKTGVFGADMQVSLVNDGPVTIILDTDKL